MALFEGFIRKPHAMGKHRAFSFRNRKRAKEHLFLPPWERGAAAMPGCRHLRHDGDRDFGR